MSERKVLNKYYPPDFDPSKIPRVKCPKNRQFTVRLMAPFNMRCKTCGEYIYKGKKFNARKEDVEGEDYLGIRIFRFYIKCTRCLQEISFKTDPQNTDYEIEAGATRNFMALKLAEEQAEKEEKDKKEEEASNPMKVLENRTKQSKHELELLESLEELKDLNRRQQQVDYNHLLSQFNTREARERILKLQEEEDEKIIKAVFSKKRVVEEIIVDESKRKKKKTDKEQELNDKTDNEEQKIDKPSVSNVKVGVLSKHKFNSLVKIKKDGGNSSTMKDAASNSTLKDTLSKPTMKELASSSSTLKDTLSKPTMKELEASSSSTLKDTLSNPSTMKDSSISSTVDSNSTMTNDKINSNINNKIVSNDNTQKVKSALSLLTSYSDSDDSSNSD